MLKFLSILFVLIIKALASDISDVVTLTPANFDDVVNGDANVLVEFYARKHSLHYTLPSASSNTFINLHFHLAWCGHCKNLAPVYEVVATNYKKHKDIIIAKVDADAEKVSLKKWIYYF